MCTNLSMKGAEELSRIIFATHGEMSMGMKNSMKMIVGDSAECIETYSLLLGENPNDYYEELNEQIKKDGESYIILCDLKGGSVHTALSRLTIHENVTVLSGMNMNMALEVVLTYKDGIPSKENMKFLEVCKNGITLLTKDKEVIEDEDF